MRKFNGDRNKKTINSVGYIGYGKYNVSVNRKTTKNYSIWHNMINRCYSEKQQKISVTYINCSVDER